MNMKNIRVITISLLFFIALNALTGGYLLMLDPSGTLLNLSIEQVGPAVFDDFLIPGIFLFLFNGIQGLLTGVFVLFQWKYYAELVIVQGMILFAWITVQIFFVDQIFYQQYAVVAIGLVLFVFGIRMRQTQANRQPTRK